MEHISDLIKPIRKQILALFRVSLHMGDPTNYKGDAISPNFHEKGPYQVADEAGDSAATNRGGDSAFLPMLHDSISNLADEENQPNGSSSLQHYGGKGEARETSEEREERAALQEPRLEDIFEWEKRTSGQPYHLQGKALSSVWNSEYLPLRFPRFSPQKSEDFLSKS